ncbi:TMV resistance protein N-like [Rhodamnia argentea]|uniref:TMV resistance protein N-like n=1 Tax=Rhodamnia argentea TaxID=178133 RepID=A0ABM3HPV0_9MYRT|nr:TMV resistance protein N-like [Rhodamnia argentea]
MDKFEEKQIFLDIACFFNGVESTAATFVWKDCGLFPENGLAALTDMSLLKRDHHDILRMHDLIRDLGREIVREENYLNAGSLKKARVLCLLNCPRLVEIQGPNALESLESIRIGQCSSLVRLPNLLKLKKLRTMEHRFCRSLADLPPLSLVAFDDCHPVVDRCDKLSDYNGPCCLCKNKRKWPNPRSRL